MYRKTLLIGLAMASGMVAGALGTLAWTPGTGPLAGPAALPETTRPPDSRDRLQDPDAGNLADVLESLARVLDDEINERRLLAERLEVLDAEVSDLRGALLAENVQPPQSTATAMPTRDDRLMAAGFTRRQLASVRRLQAEAQMAAIELDDRARREGWANTPRYYQEFRQLASGATAIREALGDELYDRYLFANGRPNRVAVGSIIETSPAEQAGFRPGDVIVRYGGENVYAPEQLNDLRSAGVRGEAVAVEVLRDGQSLQLTIPRGPMGIAPAPIFVDPAAPPE